MASIFRKLFQFNYYNLWITPLLLYSWQNLPFFLTALMNMAFVAPLLRRSGAFFIRRAMREDKLYWAVLSEYVRTIVRVCTVGCMCSSQCLLWINIKISSDSCSLYSVFSVRVKITEMWFIHFCSKMLRPVLSSQTGYAPLEFYVEGYRSRTLKSLNPKLGETRDELW